MTTYVIMAGLPGTGKSTLARALAEQMGGLVLGKDEVRAALFPGRFMDYTREQDDLCFEAILKAAHYVALRGLARFIFLDGRTFSRGEQIDQAVGAALAANSEWRILHVTCPDELAERRLLEDATHLAGNRTVEMYRRLQERFEPIERPRLVIDTSEPLARCIRMAGDYLRLSITRPEI